MNKILFVYTLLISLHKYRTVCENNVLFRKPPLLGPPLSLPDQRLLVGLFELLIMCSLFVTTTTTTTTTTAAAAAAAAAATTTTTTTTTTTKLQLLSILSYINCCCTLC